MQIARLSARVTQLTSHLQQNRKDYASTRGLTKLLGQRRRLMKFLYQNDRCVALVIQRLHLELGPLLAIAVLLQQKHRVGI